ncbi:MAG: hypothetical protein HQM06_04910 [Magnetococcales bacterium]|nr:hypothetical protein [Magnetococcales bacterium]
MVIDSWLDAVQGLSETHGWTKESAFFLLLALGYSPVKRKGRKPYPHHKDINKNCDEPMELEGFLHCNEIHPDYTFITPEKILKNQDLADRYIRVRQAVAFIAKTLAVTEDVARKMLDNGFIIRDDWLRNKVMPGYSKRIIEETYNKEDMLNGNLDPNFMRLDYLRYVLRERGFDNPEIVRDVCEVEYATDQVNSSAPTTTEQEKPATTRTVSDSRNDSGSQADAQRESLAPTKTAAALQKRREQKTNNSHAVKAVVELLLSEIPEWETEGVRYTKNSFANAVRRSRYSFQISDQVKICLGKMSIQTLERLLSKELTFLPGRAPSGNQTQEICNKIETATKPKR